MKNNFKESVLRLKNLYYFRSGIIELKNHPDKKINFAFCKVDGCDKIFIGRGYSEQITLCISDDNEKLVLVTPFDCNLNYTPTIQSFECVESEKDIDHNIFHFKKENGETLTLTVINFWRWHNHPSNQN